MLDQGRKLIDAAAQEERALIPGLPDDLALHCLSRVPRREHGKVKRVSRAWNAALGSDDLLSLRQRLGIAEAWVYALSRCKSTGALLLHALQPELRRWAQLRLPDAYARLYGVAACTVGRRLVLTGGYGVLTGVTDAVYSYDAASNRWSRQPGMARPRCYHVTAPLPSGRALLAVGGCDEESQPQSYEVLPLPPPLTGGDRPPALIGCDAAIPADLGEALAVGGHVYVRHTCTSDAWSRPAAHAAAYDVEAGTWAEVNTEMSRMWAGPAVAVGGRVYSLDQEFGMKLMVMEDGRWMPVGRLSLHSLQPPCRIAYAGGNLFVVGTGLVTLVINLEDAERQRGRGLLLTSTIAGLPHEDVVISCGVIEI